MAEAEGASGDAPAEVEVDWSAFRDLLGPESRAAPAAPGRRALLGAALALWAGAFGMVAVTWNGVAERTVVANQVPILVSGGFSAIVLAVIGAALFVAGAGRGPR